MAASGYTPISLYYSTTPTQQPTNTNLVNGELAINITDGKLYFKNNSNVVTLLASSSAASPVTTISFGSTGLTPNSATSGAVSVAGTLAGGYGGTGQSSYSTGDTLYATGATTLSKLTIGTNGQFITSTGTAPQWSSPGALTKTDDTNVTLTLGGSASTALVNAASLTLGWTGQLSTTRGGTGLSSYTAGDLPYYATGTALSKLGIGTNGQVLTSSGTAPQWSNASSIAAGSATNLSGGGSYTVVYQSAAGTTAYLTNGTTGQVLTANTGAAPTWSASSGITAGKSIALAMIFGF